MEMFDKKLCQMRIAGEEKICYTESIIYKKEVDKMTHRILIKPTAILSAV